jgi:hypothetical protein
MIVTKDVIESVGTPLVCTRWWALRINMEVMDDVTEVVTDHEFTEGVVIGSGISVHHDDGVVSTLLPFVKNCSNPLKNVVAWIRGLIPSFAHSNYYFDDTSG